MKKVIILKIDTYDTNFITARLQEVILKHFPPKKLFPNQKNILLKPNLLMASQAQEAITTHPAIIESVAKIFKEEGFNIFIGDCPGGSLSNKDLDFIYKTTGITGFSQRLNCKCLYPDKVIIKENIPFAYWIEGFGIVNICKLKTHQIMMLTLATKNLYGCIVGLHKSYLHKEFPKAADLSEVILKIYKIINPRLNIVDGVVALEGRGPAKEGRPKKLGIVAIGDDALYTDYAISELLGLSLKRNPLLLAAKNKGLLEDKLEVISEVDKIKNFKFPPQFIVNYFPTFLIDIARLFFELKPVVNNKCVGCGLCVKICPKNAITLYNKKIKFDYKKCIRCFCCQEVCGRGAIYLETGILLKIIDKIKKR